MPKRINVRAKGHNLERRLAQIFRELGYTECLTSRLESKRQDDLGVDLCHTGHWQIQAKANENLGSGHKFLAKMPQKKGKCNLLFHKKNNQGTIVSMMEEDFFIILKAMIKCGIIKT